MYDHFPELKPKDDEPYINCYNDNFVMECKRPGNNIALLLEPRSMIGAAYNYVLKHHDYFKWIFTHDSELLSFNNAILFTWGNVWLETDSVKDKGISICTSYKDWCPLHHARLKIAEFYRDKPEVDVFYGDWNNPNIPNVDAREYLEHYKYSIVLENDIDDFWYTEKILNCFATKTVPIYLGARKIDDLFNADGIIHVADWHDIPWIIDGLDIEKDYANRQVAIEDNFNRAKNYKTDWKTKFFKEHGKKLEAML